MPVEKMNDVPSNMVGQVVQSFVDDGATRVEATRKPSGNWDITATKPNN